MEEIEIDTKKIILFDGICNLCDGFVDFVYKRDKHGYFHYCRLQSPTGRKILTKYNLPTEIKTVIFVDEVTNQVFTQSTAVLKIVSFLTQPWCWFYYFIYLPQFLRDLCYRFVAANRYLLFGKKDPNDPCPFNPGLRQKSLDFGEEMCGEIESSASRAKDV
jgi:predicted DCC family thiol-disulfide oxidoreductase YuxK